MARDSGTSLVLPNPAGESVAIEFSIGEANALPHTDTIQLRTSALHFEGPATITIEGAIILVRASIVPTGDRTRVPTQPLPFALELKAVLQNDIMIGVASIQQRDADTISSFNAIARFQASHVVPPI